MNNRKLNVNNIKQINSEIKKIMKSIEEKEKNLIDINNKNINLIEKYKFFMEELITEYHGVCKKVYN